MGTAGCLYDDVSGAAGLVENGDEATAVVAMNAASERAGRASGLR